MPTYSPPAPRFGRELRTTAVLAGPLMVGHVATGLIGLVDSLIAGRHGTATLAAVSVGTAMFWLPLMIPMGTLMALPPTVSQLDGSGRRGEIGAVFRQAMWLSVILGALLFGLLTVGVHALEPMGIAEEIRPGAVAFLRGIRWGVPALALYYCMRYLSDGLHWTLPTMVFGFGGLLLLIPTGFLLTFGGWGVPEMGAGGLGWASAIVLWAQAISFFLYLVFSPRFASLRLFERFDPPDRKHIGELLRVGLPIGITVAMEGGLFVATSLLIGRLGQIEAAAHQIAINLSGLCFMVPFAVAEATTVRVGHAFGSGLGREGVRRAALAGLAVVLVTQTFSAIVLLTGSSLLAGLYTNDASVAALGASLLLLAAVYQFPDGIQVLSAGALRGLKDTRVPMLLAAISYWAVGMAVGAWLGLGLGWGPRGMWIGLIAGLSMAAVLLGTRFLHRSARIPPQAGLPPTHDSKPGAG
ncbi:MATE family efflux transporter [Luteimonas sp. A478]